ncbi:hypothetical protein BGX27_003270 [Mortierella sp. AM989]|nr:hypothetical protein BGX27_003270 [Mortierella sp. AM989]
MSFSLPPPRRTTSTGLNARRPKVNPIAAAVMELSLDPQSEEQDADTLANLLSQSHIHSDYFPQHLPQCRHYTRPRSITSTSSLSSESYSIYGSSQCGRKTSQEPRSPPLSEVTEPISSPSSRICSNCHTPSCPSLAIFEEGDKATKFCQRRALSISEDDGNEQYMADAAGYFPTCSYCSSIRSDSVSSIPEEQQHHNANVDRNPQLTECQRVEHLHTLVPGEIRRRLSFHLDECWFVHFSPSAEYMASIGRDYSIVVWKDLMSPDPSIHLTFTLSRTATTVEWSPDSRYLLVNLGYDKAHRTLIPTLKLIDVQSGEILFKEHYQKGEEYHNILAISWFPDSERFLTAVEGVYSIWNVKGQIIREYTVDTGMTGRYMMLIPGREEFVVNTLDTTEIISFDDKDELTSRLLDRNISVKFAMKVSSNGAYLVITVKGDDDLDRPAQIVLYDLKTMTFLKSFEAETYVNCKFTIVPTFVGPNLELLCAGSENGKIHYWDIETGEVIAVLEEHSMHVGCVSANPSHPGMVASCSDDGHVIIWATKHLQFELKEDDEKWMHEHPVAAIPTIAIKKGW